MFNRRFWLGAEETVPFNSDASDLRVLDFKDKRNIKLGIYCNWGSVAPGGEGAKVALIPGLQRSGNEEPNTPDYDNVIFATYDPNDATSYTNAGVRVQELADPVQNPDTNDYESFSVLTLISSEYPRFAKILVTNEDSTTPMTLETFYDTSQ